MTIEDKNLKERAHAGDPEAQLAYGLSLRWERGYFARAGVLGLDPPCEAQAWIQASADQGYAPAQFIMGKIYDSQGIGGSVIPYYRMAAEQGHQLAKRRLEHNSEASLPSLPTISLPRKVPPLPPARKI